MPAPTATGRDKDDFFPGIALFGDLGDELLQLRGVRLLAAVRQHARAEFHDDPRDAIQ
jgi:hypothetical protein